MAIAFWIRAEVGFGALKGASWWKVAIEPHVLKRSLFVALAVTSMQIVATFILQVWAELVLRTITVFIAAFLASEYTHTSAHLEGRRIKTEL